MGRGGETLGVGKEPGRKCVQENACKMRGDLSTFVNR